MAPYETAKVTVPSEADPSARSLIPRDGHADSYRAESQRRARSRGDAVKMPTRRGRGPGRWTQRHLCVLSSHPAPWASPGIQEGSQRRMVGGSYRKRCWLRGSAHLPTKASTKERKGPDAIPLEHVGQVSTTAKGPDEREVGETPSTTSEKSRRRRQTRHLCDQGSHPSTGWNLKAGGIHEVPEAHGRRVRDVGGGAIAYLPTKEWEDPGGAISSEHVGQVSTAAKGPCEYREGKRPI